MINKVKYWGLWILCPFICLFLAIVIVRTFSYSEGSRVGTIVKFSKRTNLFTSYEGTLLLGAQGSNLWDFSVLEEPIVKQVQYAHDHMQRVKLTYRWKKFSAEAKDTRYEVIKVEQIND